MHSATVHDFTPAQFRRTTTKQPSVAPQAAFSIYDDLADGIEAMHQCMNLAGFSERSRAFILALASAAHSRGRDFVKLFDEDLAQLQNCSIKTVQRQRKFYLMESQKLNFVPVEIQEGKFNQDTQRNEPTEYRFHLGEIIEQIVVEARSSKWWHDTDRDKQREAIKRAAASVYDEIPEAKSKRRKEKRPRLAVAEIETCLKVIETKLNTVKEVVSKLPFAEHDRIMDPETPGDVYAHLLKLRAKIDGLLNIDSPQTADSEKVNMGGGHFVHPPPAVGESVRAGATASPQPTLAEEPLPECVHPSSSYSADTLERSASELARAEADWAELEARICEPQIKRVEVRVRPVEPLPEDDFRLEPDPPEEVRPGPALWRNADSDVLVTVTADLGVGPDGRRYVATKESRGGVPFDEVEFPDCDETAEEWAIRMEGCSPPPNHTEYEEVF
jgi:hypothetical protein